MKRFLKSVALASIAAMCMPTAFAETIPQKFAYKTPEYIYSTDILAYIDGYAVPSYNIGGRTAIIAEDVLPYCNYDDEKRTLI